MTGMIISGVFTGIAMGWFLQRGRNCMNTAFREMILDKEFRLFRIYITALIIAIIGANLLEDLGFVSELRRQAFSPLANVIGGYIFGMGTVLAGGCGSGIWYRVGEGTCASLIAVMGFTFGILMTQNGFLQPVSGLLKSFQLWYTDNGIKVLSPESVVRLWDEGMTVEPLTLFNMLGINKWVIISLLGVAALVFILKGGLERPRTGYSWYFTGVGVGVIIIASWWVSEVWGGGARGISYTGPTGELFGFLVLGEEPTWSAFLVLGTPIGAFLSAYAYKEFKLKSSTAEDFLRVFIGGLIMGIGGVIGGGCNIGHALTGFSTLAVASITATIFIILGNWTMVYFIFIRPFRDLD
jgi:hypothetical protein